MKIKTNDTVIVLCGDNKGTTGKVLKVLPEKHQVVVEGVNVNKKHVKPSQANPTGSIKDVTLPIDISNVALVDPKSGKATKVGYKNVDGKKVRFAKKSGEEVK